MDQSWPRQLNVIQRSRFQLSALSCPETDRTLDLVLACALVETRRRWWNLGRDIELQGLGNPEGEYVALKANTM
jgi:hypothetical protein